ncbi:MAG: LytR C-terminal domain-containing protein [Coriobacteriia bacterium]|nr:LytR C-terminal domain-containing protein [Coriobacteriia bacterium]
MGDMPNKAGHEPGSHTGGSLDFPSEVPQAIIGREPRFKGIKRAGRAIGRGFLWLLKCLGILCAIALVLLLAANTVNTTVRWRAKRIAEGRDAAQNEADQKATLENIVIVGADNGVAAGFLAIRINLEDSRVYGVAVSEGTFLDVPGRGFERIGDAYSSGVDGVVSAIANYFSVPFSDYVIVPTSVYRDALTRQSVAVLPTASTASSLSQENLAKLSSYLKEVPSENVALVPLPTKPITLGERTYLEPQREQVADLLKTWWGVNAQEAEQATRVVIYNGSGVPGIAGEAAQELIRAGARVIDTQNANSFDYKVTQIIVRRTGETERGIQVQAVLGVGEVTDDPSDQNIIDLIVIIGADYKPQGVNKGEPSDAMQ